MRAFSLAIPSRSVWLASALSVALLAPVVLLAPGRGAADGFCDHLGEVDRDKRSTLGSINRSNVIPGFPAQISVRSAICNNTDSAAPDFAGLTEADVLVSLIVEPLSGPASVVVLGTGFGAADPADPTSTACPAEVDTSTCGGIPVHCVQSDLQFVDVPLPGADPTDPAERRLQFFGPSTAELPAREGIPLAGPLTVAVSTDRVPCELASPTRTCGSESSPLVACLENLFRLDGGCGTDEASIDPVISSITLLAPPIRFVEICSDTGDPTGLCQAPPNAAPPVGFTQDKHGVLKGVLDNSDLTVVVDGESFPRLVQSAVEFQGTPIVPPTGDFMEQRAVNDALLSPLFEAKLDETEPGIFRGTVDAAFGVSVLRVRRCAGTDIPCTLDSECDCVDAFPELPDVLPASGPASAPGTGPILGNCPLGPPDATGTRLPVCRILGTTTLDTITAAGLDDLAIPAPVLECVAPDELASLTGDSDDQDLALTILNRRTLTQALFGDGGAPGRAETLIVEPAFGEFGFSSHASEGPIVAMLETEAGDCELAGNAIDCDDNADGATFGSNVRVVEVSEDGTAEVSAPLLPARPALNVNRAPVEVSAGRVFWLTPAEAGPRTLTLESASPSGDPANAGAFDVALSPDGGFAGMTSASTNLGIRDVKDYEEVFVRSRANGAVTLASAQIRETCGDRLRLVRASSGFASVSEGGSFVAYDSEADRILGPPTGPPNDRNDVTDVFVFDAATCVQTRPSESSQGAEANGPSFAPSISPEGRFVAFESLATNLLDGVALSAGPTRVFLRDRDPDQDGVMDEPGEVSTSLLGIGASPSGRAVTAVCTGPDGLGARCSGDADCSPGASCRPQVALSSPVCVGAAESSLSSCSTDSDCSAEEFCSEQVIVSDGSGARELIGVGSDGALVDSTTGTPSISPNGRFVAFEGTFDVFVRDRDSQTTVRAGTRRVPSECRAGTAALDPDGRSSQARVTDTGLLVYTSEAANLVPGGDAKPDVFVEDPPSGAVARLSQSLLTGTSNGPSSGGDVSADGLVAAFQSDADDLGPAVVGGVSNVYASELRIASAGSPSVLAVYDTSTRTTTSLGAPAEFASVAGGAALFVGPPQSPDLWLLPSDCGDPGCVVDLGLSGISDPDTIAISEDLACLVDSGGVPRCASLPLADPPALDPIGPPGFVADSIRVTGSNVAVAGVDGGSRVLLVGTLPGDVRPVGEVKDFALGSAVACFTTSTANPADPEEAEIFVVDPMEGPAAACRIFPADPTSPVATAVTCAESGLANCDPRVDFTIVPPTTCKFLTREFVDLDGDGVSGETLLARCTLGDITSDTLFNVNGTPGGIDVFAGENIPGELNRSPACVFPEPPALRRVPQGFCAAGEVAEPGMPDDRCPGDQVCSDVFGIDFTDFAVDSDGDGVLDRNEICDNVANPDPVDVDGDGLPDACDACVPDGILKETEVCDPLLDDFCTGDCQLDLPTSFTTESGFTVEIVQGPGGELTRPDGAGNSVFEYLVSGKGAEGEKCEQVRAVSHVAAALPIPTCAAGSDLVILATDPGSKVEPDGDSSTGFGADDPDTDVLIWSQSVSCDGTARVSVTVQGAAGLDADVLSLKVGGVSEEGLIAGPGCPRP